MFRIAVPYGMLNSAQLRKLADVARTYDKGYGHFTTRHNMQFNWPKIEDCPDILAALAEVEMHAIQTSGNCIRNITTDQFAGVAADEVIDPRPLCRNSAPVEHLPPGIRLPAAQIQDRHESGAKEDRAVTWFHDIGLHLQAAGRRDRLPRHRRWRPRPHADPRPGRARVPALAAHPDLLRSHPARL
jgi:sulfite reductase (NADPH) hemoprotein beta-component